MIFLNIMIFLNKYFHFRTKPLVIDPSYFVILWTENYPLTKEKNDLDEQHSVSTHNFCHQILNISQSKHMGDEHGLHKFTVTVFLIKFRPEWHIYWYTLQMTGPKSLKLDVLALQFINKKPIENKEYLIICYDFLVSIWNI